MVTVFTTIDLHGYSVKFSPYSANRLGVAACQQFGIVGNSRLLILDIVGDSLSATCERTWSDALFELAWSEENDGVIVGAGGDGAIVLWNLNNPVEAPSLVLKEHLKEVYCVDWCLTRGTNLVLSASWDKTLKLWDMRKGVSVVTFSGHEGVVYCGVWAPLLNSAFLSASGDGTLRVWDVRKAYMPQAVMVTNMGSEVLCADWCKYDPNVLVGGYTDGVIRIWDLRQSRHPVQELCSHAYAVRRVKFSPFARNHIVSSAYDFTVKVFDWTKESSLLENVVHHSEFVYGLDLSTHIPTLVADCAWDRTVKVYKLPSLHAPLQG